MGDGPGVSATELETLRSGLTILALRRLGDPDAAEEVVQETLARALEALRNGRPREPGKLGAFVAGIARHVVADVYRKRGRTVSLDTLPESAHPRATADPLNGLVSASERERLRASLERLSAGDQEILRLSFFDGFTSAEIAARLREPADRIRKRKSRALKRLRVVFGDAGHTSTGSATGKDKLVEGR